MGTKSIIFSIISTFLISGLEAKSRFQNGFMDGIPLRDHYARQIVGADVAEDCMKTPQKYNVNIFNFTQPQDHFDPNNNVTWQQQVQWRNDSFKSQASGDIIFLLLGGEGPIQTTWMCFTNYTWTKLAQQHNAFMFQLEHRYFGTSAPTSDMSVANLKWLTTEQAMEDLNQFIPAMNKQFGFNKPKWVAFGGSYPGTLAALLRMSYPNITNGNIASSAPLWAKVDMWEYAEKMDQAILWASQNNASLANCHSETQKAFIYAKNATYYDTGRAELNKAFNITPPLGTNPNTTMDLDATNFLRTIFHSFQGIIQYTFDDRGNATINANGLNVNNLCVRMVDTSKSLVERLYSVYAWEQSWDSGSIPSSLNNDYWAGIAFARNTQFGSDAAAWRGWMWLCCNEFGWLPTTDNAYSIFGEILPLGYYLQYCRDIFDPSINNDYVKKNVASTLNRIGLPYNYNGTNVVLPNGSLDPWSTLGCNVTNNGTRQIAVTTPGGAHCVDMYPYTKGSPNSPEPDAVAATIQIVTENVAYYLTLDSSYGREQTDGSTTRGASMNISVITMVVTVILNFMKLF